MNGLPLDLPLRGPQLPDPVAWWPPAPGWWAVGLLGLLVLALLAGLLVRLWRRLANRRRVPRFARRALRELAAAYRRDGDGARLAAGLSVLLRRIAVTLHPRQEVARLTGEAWLEFLDRPLRGTREAEAFRGGVGRVLLEAPYNPRCPVDGKALLRLAERWIQAAARGAGNG
jgi:hypothetical protein